MIKQIKRVLKKQGDSPTTLKLNWINEALDVNPDFLYMYHKRCRKTDVSTRNVQACKGNSKV